MSDNRHSEALASLKKVSYFANLEPEILALFARHSRLLEVASEQLVFFEGEASQGLYVVVSGWLKASKIAESGREQVLRYFGEDEVVNEPSLFVEAPQQVTLIALEPSKVMLIPRQAVLNLVEEQPALLWSLTQKLAQRLMYMVNLVQDLSLLPLESRLAKYILEHAEGSTFERQTWATQAELASRLGTVPDVLQRVLRSFSKEGLVKVERQRIVILDRHALECKTQD